MSESSIILKEGDIVVKIKGSVSSTVKTDDITIVTFAGEHSSIRKIMTPELDKAFSTKCGWDYDHNFRLASPREIEAYHSGIRNINQVPKQEVTDNYEIF